MRLHEISGGYVKAPESVVDPEVLRLAMRQWATGVTIVTSLLGGIRHGMTVSSFTSVSLTPPLVLISLEWGTRTHDLVKNAGIFGVTILARQQQEISDRFAGRHTEDMDRFDGLETFTLATGVSLLEGGLASFDCQVVGVYEAGDHTIFIGDVVAAQIGPGNQPMIYYDRAYRNLME